MSGLGDRISHLVQSIFRSWYFFIAFLVWTFAWWLYLGRHFFHDIYPWVAWTTVTTLITQIDVLVVGIGQKKQQDRDSKTLRLLLTIGEANQANMAAVLAIGEAQQVLLRSTKTEIAELQEMFEEHDAGQTS